MSKLRHIRGNIGQDIIDDIRYNFKTFEGINEEVDKIATALELLSRYITIVPDGDDEGVIITNGQLSVGTRSNPNEMVVGGGDSHPLDLAFHAEMINTAGDIITDAIDISEIIASDLGSNVPFYNGITSGKYIIAGDDYPFGGAKLKWSNKGDIDPDNVVIEYLQSANNWVEANFMVTDSDYPHDQAANRLNTFDSLVEQLFVGFDPTGSTPTWGKVPLTINGVTESKYWARFRIVYDIVEDPIIEQIKGHSDAFEIEADGSTSYRGRSRYIKTLQEGLKNVVTNRAANPDNRNVKYGPGVEAEYKDNRFRYEQLDGFLLVQNVVHGLDTSIHLTLAISWYPDNDSGGDVNFGVELFNVIDGFDYINNAESFTIADTVSTVDASTKGIRRTTFILFTISTLDTNSGVVISLYRDSTLGNGLDTFTDDVIITNVRLSGHFWKP